VIKSSDKPQTNSVLLAKLKRF